MEVTNSSSPIFAGLATYGSCGEHQVQAADASDGDPYVQNEFKWTARKKVLVMLLSAVNFVTFVAFAMLAPFFPNVVCTEI